jgi:hypothetical protein
MRFLFLAIFLIPVLSLAVDTDLDGLSDADELTAGLPPLVADSDGDGLNDVVDNDMDGDGIDNLFECGSVPAIALANGGFEIPGCGRNSVCYPNESRMAGWKTTAPDKTFELWGSGFEGLRSYEGTTFSEMNAFSIATLYQDIETVPGSTYIWAFAHCGRFGTDTMDFSIGVPGGDLTVIKRAIDGYHAWGVHTGVVRIPPDQVLTRFAFVSVASSCGLSCGNMLDAISFRPACLEDTDGDLIPDALDEDTDNDGLTDRMEGTAFFRNPDRDSDGVLDGIDNCVNDSNASQADLDSDGIGNTCDSDTDGDGLHNIDDNCPIDFNEQQDNLDSDQFGDVCDDNIDGDSILNVADNCVTVLNADQGDMDSDSIGDACDPDEDGDGLQTTTDNCPKASNADQRDMDGDGQGDSCDSDRDGDGTSDALDLCPDIAGGQENLDGDLFGDACDADVDGDGVDNTADVCPREFDSAQDDFDADGIGDKCDPDLDGDLVDDSVDNCLVIPNTAQVDFDGDGLGDGCDLDIDGDSVPNVSDNCPSTTSTNVNDLDGDGLGDVCDFDLDGDNVNNDLDNCIDLVNESQADLDSDGLGDACDSDPDGDAGLADNCPFANNPDQRDFDQDGLGDICDGDIDGDDVPNNSDTCPTIFDTGPDLDGDGLGSPCDPDDDGDGITDLRDNCVRVPNADQSNLDGDDLGDACDEDKDGDGHLDTVDNCPSAPNDQADQDKDGLGDGCDGDIDGDGVGNALDRCAGLEEAGDLDADGTPNGEECSRGTDPRTFNPRWVESGGCDSTGVSAFSAIALLCLLFRRSSRAWALSAFLFANAVFAQEFRTEPNQLGTGYSVQAPVRDGLHLALHEHLLFDPLKRTDQLGRVDRLIERADIAELQAAYRWGRFMPQLSVWRLNGTKGSLPSDTGLKIDASLRADLFSSHLWRSYLLVQSEGWNVGAGVVLDWKRLRVGAEAGWNNWSAGVGYVSPKGSAGLEIRPHIVSAVLSAPLTQRLRALVTTSLPLDELPGTPAAGISVGILFVPKPIPRPPPEIHVDVVQIVHRVVTKEVTVEKTVEVLSVPPPPPVEATTETVVEEAPIVVPEPTVQEVVQPIGEIQLIRISASGRNPKDAKKRAEATRAALIRNGVNPANIEIDPDFKTGKPVARISIVKVRRSDAVSDTPIVP